MAGDLQFKIFVAFWFKMRELKALHETLPSNGLYLLALTVVGGYMVIIRIAKLSGELVMDSIVTIGTIEHKRALLCVGAYRALGYRIYIF